MRNLLGTSLIAALGLALVAPHTAAARHDDRALAAIGGFIGGVIVGSAINNHDRDYCPPPRCEEPVVVEVRHRDRGYWDTQVVSIWVPGRWVVSYDECGRRSRYLERGHYESRRERVWVEYRSRGHGRNHRDGGY